MSTPLQRFDAFFGAVSPGVDVASIRQEWQALGTSYRVGERHLPLPVWARRPFTESGEQAWAELCQDIGGDRRTAADPPKALCIYVHVPFCATRCGFCDCYSFPLRRHAARHVEQYVTLLCREARLWSRLAALERRLVSTVHLGGGTPSFLDGRSFRRLVQGLRAFGVSPATEWALESTTSDLSDEMLLLLEELGFTRLHVGVQSLQDEVRHSIGRREPAAVVLAKIGRAVRAGWVVSVDLIAGLPGQTLSGMLEDIRALAAAGVDGFSLYELQLSGRNRRFAERHGLTHRDRLETYFLFQAASRCLGAQGYRKTLFNHFARARDTNLYFTFPERGEDLLAIGTIADGVFGDYHYRHPAYKAYRQMVSDTFPGLQGGLRRTPAESLLHPLEVALLSGRVPRGAFEERLGRERAVELLGRWQDAALVAGDGGEGCLHLTSNGSWFVGNMMDQLERAAQGG